MSLGCIALRPFRFDHREAVANVPERLSSRVLRSTTRRGAKGVDEKKKKKMSGGARRFCTAAKCMRVIDSDAIAIHHGYNLITTNRVHGIKSCTYILLYVAYTGRFTAEHGQTRFVLSLLSMLRFHWNFDFCNYFFLHLYIIHSDTQYGV